jgi:hypothetical protein
MNISATRSKVCTLGNKLARVLPRKTAFGQAWDIVSRGKLELRVAGVSFGNRQEALRRLACYDPASVKAFMVPEPENPVDRNAIAVMVGVDGGRGFYRRGYVPATQTGIATVFMGQLPKIRILDGDICGARLTFTV